MFLTYRYRLYPSKEQEEILSNWLEVCRQVWNWALQIRKTAYEEKRPFPTYIDLLKLLASQKKERPQWATVHSQVLQDVIHRQSEAYRRFFEARQQKKKARPPRFKGKDKYYSFTFPQAMMKGKRRFKLYPNPRRTTNRKNFLFWPGKSLGEIKVIIHRPLPPQFVPKTLTIKLTKTGKWFLCITGEIPQASNLRGEPRLPIGIDLGLSNWATLSEGSVFANPRCYRSFERKLRQAHRRLSRKKKGSQRREKARRNLAKVYEKIANKRRDWAHKKSSLLVKKYNPIVIEDLNIKGLCRTRLGKFVHDAGWAQFISYLHYKAVIAGVQVIKVGSWGTSQICPFCGAKVPKTLEIRIHHCSICGLILPRDQASALEILRRGVGPGGSELKPVETVVPTAGLPSVANRVWEAGISASG